jgi:hypothetical protein
MRLATESPGRYGGRYVARNDKGKFFVMDDDDPDKIGDVDVIAQVTPDCVYPIGRARCFLNSDGSVNETV